MKLMQKLGACFIALIACASAHAATYCDATKPDTAQRVVYVNGIQVPDIDHAWDAVNRMHDILCTGADGDPGSKNHQAIKKNFSFDVVYNYIGFYGTTDGSDLDQDKKELFVQKTAEEAYLDGLVKLKQAHDEGVETLDLSALQGAAKVAGFADDMTPGDTPTALSSDGSGCQSFASPENNAPTPPVTVGSNSLVFDCSVRDYDMAKSRETIASLTDVIKDGSPVIVVAHSQGNMLANLAYAKAITWQVSQAQPVDIGKRVRIVNIANTSQVSLNNLSLTHEGDNVLFGGWDYDGLVGMPSNGRNWYRYTDGVSWNARDFTLDGSTMTSASLTDCALPGCLHYMDEYLSTHTVSVKGARGVIYTAQTQRLRDFFEDLVYTAATQLDVLSGPRDSDLAYDDFHNGALLTPSSVPDGYPGKDAFWTKDLTVTQPNSTKIVNGELVMYGLGSVARENLYSTNILTPGTRVEIYGKVARTSVSYSYFGIENDVHDTGYYFEQGWEFAGIFPDQILIRMGHDGGSYSYPYYTRIPPTVQLYVEKYHAYAIEYGRDGIMRFYVDGQFVGKSTTPRSDNFNVMAISVHDPGSEAHIRSVRVVALP